MSTSKQWFTTADEALLSRLFREKADLYLQLYELNKLRYRVRQAEWAARESRRTGNRKSKRRDEIQGQLAL